jgi:photosystem II stability/assembly factor-like uncharacterized protein
MNEWMRARRLSAPVRLKVGLAALLAVTLTGCSEGPDMSGIDKERERALRRYDVSQAIAANDKVVVTGMQNGAVLVSTDKGASWRRHELAKQASLVDIAVCSDGSFVAIDHYSKVWSADASGENWTSVPLEQPETPIAVACDPQGGWWVAGSHATLAGTRDRGQQWTVHNLEGDVQVTTVQFVDAQNAVALGEFGLTAYSQDGGLSWQKGEAIPGDFYPYSALFRDAREGWVAGIAGQVLHTRDGGKNWQKQDNQTQVSLYRLFMHGGVPHAVGNAGTVARLDGAVWRNLPYPDPVPVFLSGGASLPAQDAIVIGGPGGLLRSIGMANRK